MSSSSAPKVTYESCVALLTGGKLVSELPSECQSILGSLARRNSNAAAWNAKEGHDARQYNNPGAHDQAKPNERSVSEIFMQSLTPEEQLEVKKKIARTASKGGKMRTEVSPEEVEAQRIELAKQKALSKEQHPKV